MFPPRRKAWPAWSPFPASETPSNNKGKAPAYPQPYPATELSPAKGLVTTIAPPLDDADGSLPARQPEADAWGRFRDAGTLDEDSIAMKDRSSLMAHISRLESELYDYQYNMGLLLMERKEWSTKMEKLKASAQDADENLRRELAAHLIAISEAENREESLKAALTAERKHACDLEKVNKEMRADSEELRRVAENKLNEAHELIAGTSEKALQAESKLHAADAREAELSRKEGIAERKLQEAEAQEDILRREKQAFKAQQEANEEDLNRQRQSLLEWEKNLQEGQSRLLEGQKLLNQTEEATNRKECALKKMEIDLIAMKRKIETEQSLLQQSEADRMSKSSGLAIREEIAAKNEIALAKKEQELLLLQEKISSRERVLEQQQEHVKATEILVSKERERIEALENALNQREAELPEKHQDLIKLQMCVKQQKEEAESKMKECEKLLTELQLQKRELMKEEERLRVAEHERTELLNLQTCLKREIDDYRDKKKLVAVETEELRKEREKFEKEWELLDEKRERVKKELEKADQEAQRMSEWLCAEEMRLKEEKILLQDQIQRESEALRIEKEDFTRRMEQERAKWFGSVEKQREDLVRDLERKSRELEKSIEIKREETEHQLKEREMKMNREFERRKENIDMQRKLAERQREEIELEKVELHKMREEIAKHREESESQWIEIKKDINELKHQREKLREQREALIQEREQMTETERSLQQIEMLKKLRLQLRAQEGSHKYEEWVSTSNVDEMLTPSSRPDAPQAKADDDADVLYSAKHGNTTPRKLKEIPARLSWLQKCVSGLLSEKRSAFNKSTKDLVESSASLGSDFSNKQIDTESDGGKLGFDPTSRSSTSFTPSIKKDKQKNVHKTKDQSVRRTHSIAATMADAKRILEPCTEHNEGRGSHKYDGGLQMQDGRLLDSGAQSAIEQDKDTVSDRQARKRGFSQAHDTVSEAETEDTEAESEISTGGRRKRRQKDHGVSSDLKETPGMKRYNFRRSTA